MRDIEPDGESRGSGHRAHQIAGPACEIEDAIVSVDPGKSDEPPFPAAVLSVRECPGDEVVAIGNGGEQSPDVLLFADRRGEG
jgi:hypothetical protein